MMPITRSSAAAASLSSYYVQNSRLSVGSSSQPFVLFLMERGGGVECYCTILGTQLSETAENIAAAAAAAVELIGAK